MDAIAQLATKYGATVNTPTISPTISSSPLQSIASKYGATLDTPTTQSTSSFAKDWLGIQNPDTYVKDALAQVGDAITHPLKTIGNAVGAAVDAIIQPAQNFFEANKIVLGDLSNNKNWAQKTADTLHSFGADAAVVFSPINAAFSAAQKLPILKEAADLINAPFAVTGKLGDFAAEKFVDVLPIDQSNKDILRPAFEEVGALAGQILLGGKIVSMIAKGITPDKATIDQAVADTKTKVAIAEQHIQSPETIAQKYGATITPIETPKSLQPLATENPALFKSAQEAKAKGLTAEEFVKAQEPVYRGVNGSIDTGKLPITFEPSDRGYYKDIGFSVASDRKVASAYGDKTLTGYIDPNAKAIKLPNIPTEKALKTAKEQGYDFAEFVNKDGEAEKIIFNKSIIKTKSQLTDFYNKAVGGNQKTSGLAKSIEAKAIEQGMISKGFDKLANYDSSTIKEQSQIYSDFFNKGIDEVRSTLRGEKPLPEKGRSSSFVVAMEEYLKKNPNPDIAYELANSPHTSAFSQAGSELGLGQNRVQDSFTAKAQEIKKVWETKNPKAKEVKTSVLKRAKEAMNKVNLMPEELGKIEKFIESNLC